MQAKAHAGNPAFGREAHGFQEDAVQVRGVHADPGVASLDAKLALDPEGLDVDGRIRRRILGGMIEQIEQRCGGGWLETGRGDLGVMPLLDN